MRDETGRLLARVTRLLDERILFDAALDVARVARDQAVPARAHKLVVLAQALALGDVLGTDGDTAAVGIGRKVVVAAEQNARVELLPVTTVERD